MKEKALVVSYEGQAFNEAIEEALRQHPGFVGNLIAVPKGLERLLRDSKALNHNEVENG